MVFFNTQKSCLLKIAISSFWKWRWKNYGFEKTVFMCLKNTIAKIVRLRWIQICIWFYVYGISASLRRLRRRMVAEFSDNASTADQGVSLIGVAEFKYFLLWVLHQSHITQSRWHKKIYYCCKEKCEKKADGHERNHDKNIMHYYRQAF